MRRVTILGSTGSIGTNVLDVISRIPGGFKVIALSTNSNTKLLEKQIRGFRPEAVCIVDEDKAKRFLRNSSFKGLKVYTGNKGLCRMIRDYPVDVVVNAISGGFGLLPALTSLRFAKILALANKESLVMAGGIIMDEAAKFRTKIIPVDSEHSAIFQCLNGRESSAVKKIYLTGSGGPLFLKKRDFNSVTPKEAINHPKWRMGKKISIDSATLMNKGLEIIEARWLFNIDINKIEVLIHPQAVVHSMVQFIDGSIFAHLGICDMRLPIQHALTYPERIASTLKTLDFTKIKDLHFYPPDLKKFPCLKIAFEVASLGGTYPCVMNAANEIAVSAFLKKEVRFTQIPVIIKKVLDTHKNIKNPSLEDILEMDRWAREKAISIIGPI